MSVNLKPALGPHDVEDALERCSTPRDVLACLLHFAHDESAAVETETPSHADQVTLSDAEMERSARLLRDALDDETDPGAWGVSTNSSAAFGSRRSRLLVFRN